MYNSFWVNYTKKRIKYSKTLMYMRYQHVNEEMRICRISFEYKISFLYFKRNYSMKLTNC